MLEAGPFRSKNVVTQLTKNLGLYSVSAFAYWLIGYTLMYPGGSWTIGSDAGRGILGECGTAAFEAVGISAEDADDTSYAPTGSNFFFKLMSCAATA